MSGLGRFWTLPPAPWPCTGLGRAGRGEMDESQKLATK